jgi:hypothetical protein
MTRTGYIAFTLILLLSSINKAIAQNRNTLIITEDYLVLQIDLKSPSKQLDSIFNIAGITNFNATRLLKHDFSDLKNDGWAMTSHENSIFTFRWPLTDLNNNPQNRPYLVTTWVRQPGGEPGYPDRIKYGINKYKKVTAFQLSSGLTRFILPGFTDAKRVFLSGSFNEWSTLKGLMTKTDGGWIIDIKLEAGAYEYKYIIDGHWATDPNNLVQMNDGAGNVNSVYYKYNFKFKLPGNSQAQRVMVAGDFNKWDADELIMEKKDGGWERDMYLNDGVHNYRFMVDGKWMTDPVNPVKVKDEKGDINSVINLGETVVFRLAGYESAKKVFVAGDFNNWKADEYSLQKNGNSWRLPVVLIKGNYSYKFIVDGKWITDPQNPYFSVQKGQKNSFLAVMPNHTFKLKGFSDAKTVVITGTFDNWDPKGYTLEHVNDKWIIEFYLKPGKYLYKFVVDGKWIIDPGNKLWEENEFGTGNSVLWIEP